MTPEEMAQILMSEHFGDGPVNFHRHIWPPLGRMNDTNSTLVHRPFTMSVIPCSHWTIDVVGVNLGLGQVVKGSIIGTGSLVIYSVIIFVL